MADAKKNNAPKDVNIALVSTPIRLQIVQTPLKLSVSPPGELKPESKVEVPVTIERLYGFADKVDLSIQPPKGVAGLAGKLSIAKNAKTGKLVITAAKNAKPGEHAVTVRADATFNKVKVSATQVIKLKVLAAAKAK